MRRIRVALLLLSLAILLPVALLAWRALGGLAYERAARHQVVAERVFEEMERALSEFLAREEARPAAQYRFYLDDGITRSPLSQPAQEPFVVGAFELAPDGTLRASFEPEDSSLASARGDWPPAPATREAIARVRRAVRAGFAAPEKTGVLAKAAREPLPQAPGTTRSLDDALAERDEEAAAGAAPAASPPSAQKDVANTYDILQSFNAASRERAADARKQKLAEAETQSSVEGRRFDLRGEAAPQAALGRDALAGADEWKEFPAEPEPAWRQIELEPMVGRLAGDRELLLVRTVQRDRDVLRQGLVLDRDALARWLSERGLAPGGLAQVAHASFLAADAAPPAPGDAAAFVFRHRFSEPFDALAAQLELAALPGVGSPGTIYALVGLLLLVGAGGLLALHRMVAVVVGFAERRSNFVAAVTHELKTPLTAIRMYAEMLRDGLVPGDAKRDEYYRTITDESERLSRLIDNVLEFARLERGKRELNLRAGDVAPVLEEALAKLRSHAARQGFELELAADPALPPVQFDRDALLQVLFNLVDNAMKYARGAGARRVCIEARRAGDGVEVAVRDFGPGVAAKHLARIFEPFYRGEDELTRSTQGTGIGLALVRELCARMGAKVSGANAQGGGFRVSLGLRGAAAA
jgi:signal transduction histidine kinase